MRNIEERNKKFVDEEEGFALLSLEKKKQEKQEKEEKDEKSLFTKAVEAVEKAYFCRVDEGGTPYFGRKRLTAQGEEKDYFVSSDTSFIEKQIAAYAVPGTMVPKSIVEVVLGKMEVDALYRAEAGVEPYIAPEPRLGQDIDGNTWLDTSSEQGAIVIKNSGEWSFSNNIPEEVSFVRSGFMSAMKVGAPTGKWRGVEKLWEHVNADPEDRLKILAWLVSRLVDPISALPIMLLQGGSFTGKSTMAKRLKTLVDPSTNEKIIVSAAGKKAADVAPSLLPRNISILDNMTSIDQRLSDFLCVVVTGGSDEGRKYYTNSGLSSSYIRRGVIVTTTGLGMLREDLVSRMVRVQLSELKGKKRSERVADLLWEKDVEEIRSSLLTLAAKVKKELEENPQESELRIAAYMETLKALELIFTREGLETYNSAESIIREQQQLQEDTLPAAIEYLVNYYDEDEIIGRPGEILAKLEADANRKGISTIGFPNSGRGFSTQLNQNMRIVRKYYSVNENYGNRKTSFVIRLGRLAPSSRSSSFIEDDENLLSV